MSAKRRIDLTLPGADEYERQFKKCGMIANEWRKLCRDITELQDRYNYLFTDVSVKE